MVVILCAVLSVGVLVWFVLAPLFEVSLAGSAGDGAVAGAEAGVSATSYGVLLDAKERSVGALRDLELDFAMGKVSAEDFESAKRTLTREVAAILAQLGPREG